MDLEELEMELIDGGLEYLEVDEELLPYIVILLNLQYAKVRRFKN